MMATDSPLPSVRLRWGFGHAFLPLILIAVLALGALGFGTATGFLDGDDLKLLGARDSSRPALAVLFLSGDIGARFGDGPHIIKALAGTGYPVMVLSSPSAFGVHRSRDQVDAIVASAIRDTVRRTGADRLVVIGQSFGADMLQTGLAGLPSDERSKVAAITLVVPGRSVFFRADPSSLSYHGTPDSDGRVTGGTITWAPVICIYGLDETDSLCPDLNAGNVKRIGLPGGHFLNRDYERVSKLVEGIVKSIAPPPRALS